MGKYDKWAEGFVKDWQEATIQTDTVTAPYGGTCNFDSPVLWANAHEVKAVNKAAGQEILSPIGYGFWRGASFIRCAAGGQGTIQTMRAEFMAKYLEGKGYKTSVYYAID